MCLLGIINFLEGNGFQKGNVKGKWYIFMEIVLKTLLVCGILERFPFLNGFQFHFAQMDKQITDTKTAHTRFYDAGAFSGNKRSPFKMLVGFSQAAWISATFLYTWFV